MCGVALPPTKASRLRRALEQMSVELRGARTGERKAESSSARARRAGREAPGFGGGGGRSGSGRGHQFGEQRGWAAVASVGAPAWAAGAPSYARPRESSGNASTEVELGAHAPRAAQPPSPPPRSPTASSASAEVASDSGLATAAMMAAVAEAAAVAVGTTIACDLRAQLQAVAADALAALRRDAAPLPRPLAAEPMRAANGGRAGVGGSGANGALCGGSCPSGVRADAGRPPRSPTRSSPPYAARSALAAVLEEEAARSARSRARRSPSAGSASDGSGSGLDSGSDLDVSFDAVVAAARGRRARQLLAESDYYFAN
mmetsp:Transcript_42080/g.98766  ORF Transcript_42080/g.98766 Transcript_42080/m.98766 type:complete len:317 (+) Transcript_42080:79-1029(+)